MQIAFALENAGGETRNLNVDLAVHFIKKSGRPRPKVFRVKSISLLPGDRVELAKTLSLADMTTRKHYPGMHEVFALVNGRPVPVGNFTLV